MAISARDELLHVLSTLTDDECEAALEAVLDALPPPPAILANPDEPTAAELAQYASDVGAWDVAPDPWRDVPEQGR